MTREHMAASVLMQLLGTFAVWILADKLESVGGADGGRLRHDDRAVFRGARWDRGSGG